MATATYEQLVGEILAELAIEELAAYEELAAQQASTEDYLYYYNGHAEGVY